MISQHDEEDEEDNVDNSEADDEENYRNKMARPLFNTDEDEEDPSYEEEQDKRKGVHWGADVE